MLKINRLRTNRPGKNRTPKNAENVLGLSLPVYLKTSRAKTVGVQLAGPRPMLLGGVTDPRAMSKSGEAFDSLDTEVDIGAVLWPIDDPLTNNDQRSRNSMSSLEARLF